MPEVRIDGVLYVPVTEANPNVDVLTDALVEQWGGPNWRMHYPDALDYLRVNVTDAMPSHEGEPIIEFIARVTRRL